MRRRFTTSLPALAITATAFATPPARALIRAQSDRAGVVSIVVRNAGRSAIELDSQLRLEVLHRGRWIPSDRAPATLDLIADCSASAPPCRTLARGETLRVVPWSGYNALIQCPHATPSDFRAPEGVYRVVARSCDHTQTFASPAFDRTHLEPL